MPGAPGTSPAVSLVAALARGAPSQATSSLWVKCDCPACPAWSYYDRSIYWFI